MRLDPVDCDAATYRSHMLGRGREINADAVEFRIKLYRTKCMPALRLMLDSVSDERKVEILYNPGTPINKIAEMVEDAFANELRLCAASRSGGVQGGSNFGAFRATSAAAVTSMSDDDVAGRESLEASILRSLTQ